MAKSENEYLFKVKLKGQKRIWRTIALRGDQTLAHLHKAIFQAFDRFDPHLYSFYFPKAWHRNRKGPETKEFTAPEMLQDGGGFGWNGPKRSNAAKTKLDALDLNPGDTFEYLFDFGDS